MVALKKKKKKIETVGLFYYFFVKSMKTIKKVVTF